MVDYCPWPIEGGFVSPMRMEIHQLEDYVSSIKNIKNKIKIGLQVEYFEEYIP